MGTFSYKFLSVNNVSSALASNTGSNNNRSRNIYILYTKHGL